MLVGEAMKGKSTLLNTLKDALNKLKQNDAKS